MDHYIGEDNSLAILVLSCDKYKDVWNDFFNLKEMFWPDCPYHCYLATDTVEYQREGVDVIHFGNIRTWSICAYKALSQIKESYVALFLEDAFIYKTIDTRIVAQNLKFCYEHHADFLTMERNRMRKTITPEDQVVPHIWKIDKHQKYGIDTSAAIWNKQFLLDALMKHDCDAWQFEVNYCREAETEEGLSGAIYFDDRQPFNISPIEIVRLGKINPDAVRFYKKMGYDINVSEREIMSWWQTLFVNMKARFFESRFFTTVVKKVFQLFGTEFFT